MRALITPLLALGVLLAGCGCKSTVDTGALENAAGAELDRTHGAWSAILAQHVRGKGFDYAALAADPAPLHAYLASLAGVSADELAAWDEAERFAYWINAYNAFTIYRVVEAYPIDSIRELSGLFGIDSVFDERFIPLRAGGLDQERLSLNDIEHRILRARFEDARVHAAINCASKSCPPLRNEAFVAATLDAQLDEQMRAFVADRELNRHDVAAMRIEISKIFDWFAADFERDAGTVRAYYGRYTREADKKFVYAAKVGYLKYDWSLNQAR